MRRPLLAATLGIVWAAVGMRSFAKPARVVVLQKGDNVTIIRPETERRVKHRFLADSLQGLPQARDARLTLQLISRVVD